MKARPRRETVPVIGTPIDVIDWDTALARIDGWAAARDSRYVCICNAHSLVTAARDPAFARVLAQADMVTPDGAPVAWMIRRLGVLGQRRIDGPGLMWRYCALAERSGVSIYLFGGTNDTLVRLQGVLAQHFPRLKIAGAASPPFREATPAEAQAQLNSIEASGAGVVFVSLGCPKQELWMARHGTRLSAVSIGVGAAFAFHTGDVKRAPDWMREAGFEWLHRLAHEPRRLWRRYLVTNTAFILMATAQLLRRSR